MSSRKKSCGEWTFWSKWRMGRWKYPRKSSCSFRGYTGSTSPIPTSQTLNGCLMCSRLLILNTDFSTEATIPLMKSWAEEEPSQRICRLKRKIHSLQGSQSTYPRRKCSNLRENRRTMNSQRNPPPTMRNLRMRKS